MQRGCDLGRGDTGPPVEEAAGVNLVVLGRPGSGKGTQAALLADTLGLELLATSALLRRVSATETPAGKAVEAAMAASCRWATSASSTATRCR